MVHPLSLLLDDAAHGRFPPPDGVVHVLPPLPAGIEALVAFTGTFALTGAIGQADVDARVPAGALGVPTSPAFVTWVSEQLGKPATSHDVLLVSISPGAVPPELAEPVRALELEELAASDHPRVATASRSRRATRIYETLDHRAVVTLGRGITGRWEVAFEVADAARGTGLGRAVVAAAVRTLPEGTPVWAQVAPGNAASLRAMIGAGFRPVGGEILFIGEPG